MLQYKRNATLFVTVMDFHSPFSTSQTADGNDTLLFNSWNSGLKRHFLKKKHESEITANTYMGTV